MRPVILASASPRRKEILSKLNIPFMVEVSNVNEEDISMKPEGLVQELSLRKAKAVSEHHQDDIVIGADTVVATGEGQDKAGSYAIQGIFGQYIIRYEGDYDNVVGLPGEHVKQILEEL